MDAVETLEPFFLQLSRPDHPFLHRLAQYFQHRTLEFRQFVQEKHSILSQANIPGLRKRAAPHESRISDTNICCGETLLFNNFIGIHETTILYPHNHIAGLIG